MQDEAGAAERPAQRPGEGGVIRGLAHQAGPQQGRRRLRALVPRQEGGIADEPEIDALAEQEGELARQDEGGTLRRPDLDEHPEPSTMPTPPGGGSW